MIKGCVGMYGIFIWLVVPPEQFPVSSINTQNRIFGLGDQDFPVGQSDHHGRAIGAFLTITLADPDELACIPVECNYIGVDAPDGAEKLIPVDQKVFRDSPFNIAALSL